MLKDDKSLGYQHLECALLDWRKEMHVLNGIGLFEKRPGPDPQVPEQKTVRCTLITRH